MIRQEVQYSSITRKEIQGKFISPLQDNVKTERSSTLDA